MGTRGQVHIKDTDIYLYQHYDAYNLPEKIRKVIEEGKRLDDPEYLARIIFCEMVKDSKDQECGFGIGNDIHDDVEFLVRVDCRNGIVTDIHYKNGGTEYVSTGYSFAEALEDAKKSSNGHKK